MSPVHPDQGRRELRDAAADPAQIAAAVEALDVLGEGFGTLERSMQVGHLWEYFRTHVQSDSQIDKSEIPEGLFEALALLNGTAASLIYGAATLIAAGNFYASAALNRQLVEVEYLAWAFNNDIPEVVNWYGSTKEERLSRWQPRHLRKKSAGKFPDKDYAMHCEVGGHPTPDGMRSLLNGDAITSTALQRFEVLSHGYSAWLFSVAAVEALCARYGADPVLVLPTDRRRVEAAWQRWNDAQKLTETWARVRPADT